MGCASSRLFFIRVVLWLLKKRKIETIVQSIGLGSLIILPDVCNWHASWHLCAVLNWHVFSDIFNRRFWSDILYWHLCLTFSIDICFWLIYVFRILDWCLAYICVWSAVLTCSVWFWISHFDLHVWGRRRRRRRRSGLHHKILQPMYIYIYREREIHKNRW